MSAQSYQTAKTSSCERLEEQKQWCKHRLVYRAGPADLPVLQAIDTKEKNSEHEARDSATCATSYRAIFFIFRQQITFPT